MAIRREFQETQEEIFVEYWRDYKVKLQTDALQIQKDFVLLSFQALGWKIFEIMVYKLLSQADLCDFIKTGQHIDDTDDTGYWQKGDWFHSLFFFSINPRTKGN